MLVTGEVSHSEVCKVLAVERGSSAPDFVVEARVKFDDGDGGLTEQEPPLICAGCDAS